MMMMMMMMMRVMMMMMIFTSDTNLFGHFQDGLLLCDLYCPTATLLNEVPDHADDTFICWELFYRLELVEGGKEDVNIVETARSGPGPCPWLFFTGTCFPLC